MNKKIQIWQPCNIYRKAKIGDKVSIGMFSEISGDIGDNVRIGKGCFIPEGVTIEDNVFIGPHVTFTNDKYPPSKKEDWEKTVVKKGASIGAAAVILCGITIGEGSTVGAGSIVTRDVPRGTTVCGNPAKEIIKEASK